METMPENQARHDDQIRGLIRAAELQKANLEQPQPGLIEFKTDDAAWIRELLESRRTADEHVNQLVTLIRDLIHRSSPQNQLSTFHADST